MRQESVPNGDDVGHERADSNCLRHDWDHVAEVRCSVAKEKETEVSSEGLHSPGGVPLRGISRKFPWAVAFLEAAVCDKGRIYGACCGDPCHCLSNYLSGCRNRCFDGSLRAVRIKIPWNKHRNKDSESPYRCDISQGPRRSNG